jgi:hypothetical protein
MLSEFQLYITFIFLRLINLTRTVTDNCPMSKYFREHTKTSTSICGVYTSIKSCQKTVILFNFYTEISAIAD